jgi:hypothetical protein
MQGAALSGFGRRLNRWDWARFRLYDAWQVSSDGGHYNRIGDWAEDASVIPTEGGVYPKNSAEFTRYRSDNLKIKYFVLQESYVVGGDSIPTARQCDRYRPVPPRMRNDCLRVTLEDHLAAGNPRADLINDCDFNF